LPGVLASLRAQAERLRVENDERSPERISGVVAAMESLRLELMSMGAGVASIPDVTRNLEAARLIAERVDHALRSRDVETRPRPHGETPQLDTPA
jgi:beta-phosphoglucomutase-like phosphatase (HAD superfamily)